MATVSEDLKLRQSKSNFPAIKKVYKTGSFSDIKMPFREVEVELALSSGMDEKSQSLRAPVARYIRSLNPVTC